MKHVTLRLTFCEYTELIQCVGFAQGVLLGSEWFEKEEQAKSAIEDARQKLGRVCELLDTAVVEDSK